MFQAFQTRKATSNETVVSLYEAVRDQNACLLQSGQDGKWSFIGLNPKKIFRFPPLAKGGVRGGSSLAHNPEKILQNLKKILNLYKTKPLANLPPFTGGLMGFFSYDFGAKLMNINQTVKSDLICPDLYFGLYDEIICFDHVKNKIWFFAWAKTKKIAAQKIKTIINKVDEANKINKKLPASNFELRTPNSPLSSNLTLAQYKNKISQIKNYLALGHTYQVNFSRRFETKTNLDSFEIYKKVTQINPSPFQAYFETNDFAIISNSPERLVRVYHDFKNKQNITETQPIKGTISRGKTANQDEKNKQLLLNSEKDKAELIMIVDLARNDIGKICKLGSVKVTEDRIIKGYSHVWHTMSTVSGILEKNKNFIDVIKAVFPGGSITGCPKKRTIEIIDELENFTRGVYCGSAGYVSFNGQMDFNIMIRTMFYQNSSPCTQGEVRRGSGDSGKTHHKDFSTHLSFHSGGGIVIDSQANDEYKETLFKAEALIKSLKPKPKTFKKHNQPVKKQKNNLKLKSYPLGTTSHLSRKDIYDHL